MRWVQSVGCGTSFQPVGCTNESRGIKVRGEGKPLKVNGLAKTEVVMWLRKMMLQKPPQPMIRHPVLKETVGLTPSPEKVEMSGTNLLVR